MTFRAHFQPPKRMSAARQPRQVPRALVRAAPIVGVRNPAGMRKISKTAAAEAGRDTNSSMAIMAVEVRVVAADRSVVFGNMENASEAGTAAAALPGNRAVAVGNCIPRSHHLRAMLPF